MFALLAFISCGPSKKERLKNSKYQPGNTVVLKGMSDTLVIINLVSDPCGCNPTIYEAKRIKSNHIDDTPSNIEEVLIDHKIDELELNLNN